MSVKCKKSKCNCVSEGDSKNFSSWANFIDFSKKISQDDCFEPIAVETPYSNVDLMENWYKCLICGTVWRLVEPDPPFAGLWSQVRSL